MDKKYRRRILFGIIILLIAIIVIIGLRIRSKHNYENGILSASEKRWIENNKNELIDIALVNDVPIFGTSGSGVFFSLLDDFSEKTGLSFNKIAYNYGSNNNYDYAFKVLRKNEIISENDAILYEDSYVVVSKNNREIYNISDISNGNIGLLSSELSDIAYHLDVTSNVSYTKFDNVDQIIEAMEKGSIDYFIVSETLYLDRILSNNYYIIYTLFDMKNRYVLSLNGNKTLNRIFQKFLNTWLNENINDYYNEEYIELYYKSKSITENEKYSFNGKTYRYGYISNMPFEEEQNNIFSGLNKNLFDSFIDFSNVEIEYEKFDTTTDLINAFNSGRIDIIFNHANYHGIKTNYITTASPYNSSLLVLKKRDSNKVISSLISLDNEKVYMMDNLLATYIKENSKADIYLKENINKLFNKSNELIIVDRNTYNFYVNTKLKNYTIAYEKQINTGYNYLIKDSDDNKLFGSLLSYYLLKNNKKHYENTALVSMVKQFKEIDYNIIYYGLGILFFVLVVMYSLRKKKRKYNKEDKVRYIDHLTSLKNRNYLNSNYSKWEENTIYPQTIIIINMNNLSHVNDVYGHEEGDSLIKLAANKLINNQLSQSDIIRTDGNEFLIYMVGYDENKVITYIKKLYKELKEVPHGFGATIGYSMIEDDIKTIDDAINEAILDIKTNKELPEKQG